MHWYNVVIHEWNVDGETGKRKKTSEPMLLQAVGAEEVSAIVHEYYSNFVGDTWEIFSIKKSNIHTVLYKTREGQLVTAGTK